MSLSLFNHDGSWFKVESPDIKTDVVKNEDVISLSVTEEMARMDTGAIQLLDRNNIYSRILRPGVTLKISWGTNKGQLNAVSRSPIEVMVNSPSGGGESGGRILYNCSFMAVGFRGQRSVHWYETGTKADVVQEVLQRIGVPLYNIEVNFTRGKEKISDGTKICQTESDFNFIVKCAREWRVAFRIGRDKKGNPIACFVDYEKLAASRLVLAMTGNTSTYFEYGGANYAAANPLGIEKAGGLTGKANVLSYSWQDHSMDSAMGQGVNIIMIDGKPSFQRYNIDDETVTTWRLVPELIEQELKTKDITGQVGLMKDYLSAQSFDQIERFFVQDTTTTAPQGSGVTVDVKSMGNPRISAGMIASFGPGFPSRIGATKNNGTPRVWWIRSATHNLSTAGYFTDVSIADAYTFSPMGQVL